MHPGIHTINGPALKINDPKNTYHNENNNENEQSPVVSRVKLRSVNVIDEKYRYIFSAYPYFNAVQSLTIDTLLESDDSVVVAAPTGSGKTVLFELAIIRLLKNVIPFYESNFKIVYMAPIKALCSERFADWKVKFSKLNLNCLELTGDFDDDVVSVDPYHLILTTPEKWDSLTRKWKDNHFPVLNVKLFMIDEIHLLNEEKRGPTLEAVVCRMKLAHSVLKNSIKIRFIAVSATIPNGQDIAHWFNSPDSKAHFYQIGEELRPVKLTKIVNGYPMRPNQSPYMFDMSLNYKLKFILLKYAHGKPTLIFCNTRKGVYQTGNVLMQDLSIQLSLEQKNTINSAMEKIEDIKLKELLKHGIGYHHAGVSTSDRHMIEDLFRNGSLPILIATSTLAMGLNLPAHLVIIKSTEYYGSGGYQEYSESQVLQMIGRAGRPQYDTEATAVIMTKESLKARYENLVQGVQAVESNLHRYLTEHLNAEVVLRTIPDVSLAMEWIRATFLYIRTQKNPVHYKLPSNLSVTQMEVKLQDWCLRELNGLVRYKLATLIDGFEIQPTTQGAIMARYSISFETMKVFFKIKGSESLKELLSLFVEAEEFKDIKLRVNERKILNSFNRRSNLKTIRFPLPGKIKSQSMKVNCLIQATLGSLPIQDASLIQEVNKIFRIGQRLAKGLVQILWTQDDLYQSLLSAILLSKCLHARMWEDSENVSRQLSGIGSVLSSHLVAANKKTFKDLLSSNPRDLELILYRNPPFGNLLIDEVKTLPCFELKVDFSPSGDTILVEVKLENIDDVKKSSNLHHIFYLLIGSSKNSVLHKSQFTLDSFLKRQGFYQIAIVVDSNFERIFAHILSRDWVGLDVCREVTRTKNSTESLFDDNECISCTMTPHIPPNHKRKNLGKKSGKNCVQNSLSILKPEVEYLSLGKRKNIHPIDQGQKKMTDFAITPSRKLAKSTFTEKMASIKETNKINASINCREEKNIDKNTLRSNRVSSEATGTKNYPNILYQQTVSEETLSPCSFEKNPSTINSSNYIKNSAPTTNTDFPKNQSNNQSNADPDFPPIDIFKRYSGAGTKLSGNAEKSLAPIDFSRSQVKNRGNSQLNSETGDDLVVELTEDARKKFFERIDQLIGQQIELKSNISDQSIKRLNQKIQKSDKLFSTPFLTSVSNDLCFEASNNSVNVIEECQNEMLHSTFKPGVNNMKSFNLDVKEGSACPEFTTEINVDEEAFSRNDNSVCALSNGIILDDYQKHIKAQSAILDDDEFEAILNANTKGTKSVGICDKICHESPNDSSQINFTSDPNKISQNNESITPTMNIKNNPAVAGKVSLNTKKLVPDQAYVSDPDELGLSKEDLISWPHLQSLNCPKIHKNHLKNSSSFEESIRDTFGDSADFLQDSSKTSPQRLFNVTPGTPTNVSCVSDFPVWSHPDLQAPNKNQEPGSITSSFGNEGSNFLNQNKCVKSNLHQDGKDHGYLSEADLISSPFFKPTKLNILDLINKKLSKTGSDICGSASKSAFKFKTPSIFPSAFREPSSNNESNHLEYKMGTELTTFNHRQNLNQSDCSGRKASLSSFHTNPQNFELGLNQSQIMEENFPISSNFKQANCFRESNAVAFENFDSQIVKKSSEVYRSAPSFQRNYLHHELLQSLKVDSSQPPKGFCIPSAEDSCSFSTKMYSSSSNSFANEDFTTFRVDSELCDTEPINDVFNNDLFENSLIEDNLICKPIIRSPRLKSFSLKKGPILNTTVKNHVINTSTKPNYATTFNEGDEKEMKRMCSFYPSPPDLSQDTIKVNSAFKPNNMKKPRNSKQRSCKNRKTNSKANRFLKSLKDHPKTDQTTSFEVLPGVLCHEILEPSNKSVNDFSSSISSQESNELDKSHVGQESPQLFNPSEPKFGTDNRSMAKNSLDKISGFENSICAARKSWPVHQFNGTASDASNHFMRSEDQNFVTGAGSRMPLQNLNSNFYDVNSGSSNCPNLFSQYGRSDQRLEPVNFFSVPAMPYIRPDSNAFSSGMMDPHLPADQWCDDIDFESYRFEAGIRNYADETPKRSLVSKSLEGELYNRNIMHIRSPTFNKVSGNKICSTNSYHPSTFVSSQPSSHITQPLIHFNQSVSRHLVQTQRTECNSFQASSKTAFFYNDPTSFPNVEKFTSKANFPSIENNQNFKSSLFCKNDSLCFQSNFN